MATSDSREVVIEASPEEVLDVIADVGVYDDFFLRCAESRQKDKYADDKPSMNLRE